MRLHTNHLAMRVIGSLVGAGFLAFGLLVISWRGAAVDEALGERALWYGITLLIAGLAALVASWTVRDPSEVWCRQPRRWGAGDRDRP